jgi:hypothetical protein
MVSAEGLAQRSKAENAAKAEAPVEEAAAEALEAAEYSCWLDYNGGWLQCVCSILNREVGM